jgi:environmental stress-induced protein Ves
VLKEVFNMKCSLFKNKDYKVSEWTGGFMKELAVFPRTSKYIDRDFIWRLSSDNVTKEEASFSKLPDYDRVIMVLEGEAVLSYEGQRVARLAELEQDRFDGDWKTISFGEITDYNLIVRKGEEGYLDLIFPKSEYEICCSTEKSEKMNSTHALYCRDGYFVVSVDDESYMIKQGEQFVIEGEPQETIQYGIMGEGTIVRAQIFYGDAEDIGPQIIPREKATFDDFKLCIYLSNVQFRWAKYIVKSLRRTWFDEELSKAIKKIERFYITTLIFLIGIASIIALFAKGILDAGMSACIIAIWVAVDCLLISPAVYMAFMPKPIRKHIKDIENLTSYEQRVYKEELAANPELEKIMKKYKNSGKNLGKDE